MFKNFGSRSKIYIAFKAAFHQFKNQSAYEIRNVSVCQKTGQHIIEIKVTGKGQSISCLAEEIVVDNNEYIEFLNPYYYLRSLINLEPLNNLELLFQSGFEIL